MVKRYDPNMRGFHKTDMCEDSDGDYVLYSDYQKLQGHLGKAEEVLNKYSNIEQMNDPCFDGPEEGALYGYIDEDDFSSEMYKNSSGKFCSKNFYGKRARQYFKEKENK